MTINGLVDVNWLFVIIQSYVKVNFKEKKNNSNNNNNNNDNNNNNNNNNNNALRHYLRNL